MSQELESFIQTWEFEAQQTAKLLRALPEGQYDFRPWADGRSIGEMAWHLAEIEGYMTNSVANSKMDFDAKLPGLERPRQIAELAPGYERVHRDAVARVKQLKPEDLSRAIPFFGRELPISTILWGATLHHLIHHRAQLGLMTRLAGGKPPGMYGPNREDYLKMREAMEAKK
jgi:uncharacterized damage-inducible protein DinB